MAGRKIMTEQQDAPVTITEVTADGGIAPQPTPDAPTEPVDPSVDSWAAREAAAAPPPAPEPTEVAAKRGLPEGDGDVWISYEGGADAISIQDFKFSPRVPVEVPKDVAEALLTFPHEEFRVVDPPAPPTEE